MYHVYLHYERSLLFNVLCKFMSNLSSNTSMNTPMANEIHHKPLITIIICALLLQLFGHYFATKFFVYEGFQSLWPVLRIVLPIFLLLILAIPLRVFNISLPVFDKQSAIVVGFSCIGLCLLAVYLGNFADDYLSYYRRGASLELLRKLGRFERFMMFTASTLIAWEIFHRGFLLGSLRYCFENHLKIQTRSSDIIAMLFVASFEALFHIKKPMHESIPLIFASIILSWLTIRTKSLWPALIIHFAIEVIFGYSAFIGW